MRTETNLKIERTLYKKLKEYYYMLYVVIPSPRNFNFKLKNDLLLRG